MSPATPTPSAVNVDELLHQIAEQRRTASFLRESEHRWYNIFAAASVGLAELSLQGRCTRVNDSFCALLGRSRSDLLTSRLDALVHGEELASAVECLRRTSVTGERTCIDNRYMQPRGAVLWANTQFTCLRDLSSRPCAILMVVVDLTERRRTQAVLLRSEAEFRALFEVAAVGIAQINALEGSFIRFNRRFVEMIGLNEFKLQRLHLLELVDPLDAPDVRLALQRTAELGNDEHTGPKRILRANGVSHWVDLTVTLVQAYGGEPPSLLVILQDVDARVRMEQEISLARDDLEARVLARTAELDALNRELSIEVHQRERSEQARRELLGQLVTAQEDERRRISRELHDTIGQHVTGLILGLKSLERSELEEKSRETLTRLQELAVVLGKEVHEMALQLRPTALDDLGLKRAVENLVEQWSQLTGVHVDYHVVGLDENRVAGEIETAVYRITQEALHNVRKHTAATHASVVLERKAQLLTVIIEDNGCGFDMDASVRPGRRPLGVVGMRERAALLNGELRIESAEGAGTTVFLSIPIN
jgi:PAS domain S-box-containing protein